MLFRSFAVRMSLASLTGTVMKLPFLFLCHCACPSSFLGEAYHKCSSYFWTNPYSLVDPSLETQRTKDLLKYDIGDKI
jgi:hypothetical protein